MLLKEAKRKAFHVVGAVAALPVLLLAPLPVALGIAGIAIVAIWASYVVDVTGAAVPIGMAPLQRTVSLALRETRRVGEEFPWASILFLLGMCTVAVASDLLGLPLAFALASFGVLGFGDTASAFVGLRFGRHKLPWNPRKSWEGTAAGGVAAFAAALAFAWAYYDFLGLPLPGAFPTVALAGAMVGMAVESWPPRLFPFAGDNFAVPVAAFVAMATVGAALGLA